MAIIDSIKGIFAGKKTIARVTLDELRQERIRIEHEEAKVLEQIEELENRKKELFKKGRDQSSQRQQIVLARRIKELDTRVKSHDTNARMLSKQLRVVNGFIQIKDHKDLVEKTKVSGLLSKMDLASLEDYVEAATIEGQFQMDKFENLIETMETSGPASLAGEEDPDTLAIVELMNEAKFESDTADESESTKKGIEKINEILKKEPPEPESDI